MAKQLISLFLSVFAAASLQVACQPAALDEIIDPNTQEPEVVPERTTIPYSLKVGTEGTRVSYDESGNTYSFKPGDKIRVKGTGDRTDIEGILTQRSGDDYWSGSISYLTSKGAPAADTQLEITLIHADNQNPETYSTALVGSAPQGTSMLKLAIENYSLFTAQVAFGDHAGTLEQQSTFLELDVTFDFDGTHQVEPGEALLDLRTEDGEATGRTPFIPLDNNEDFKVQFVAVIPGGKTTEAFTLTIGDRAVTFTQTDIVLNRNMKYRVTRTVDYGPQLGDPFWSDGTYGRLNHADQSASIVGIIVYVNHKYSSTDPKAAIDDAITEKTADNRFGHGLVMALENAAEGVCWSKTDKKCTDNFVKTPRQTIGADYASNFSGYRNTLKILETLQEENEETVGANASAALRARLYGPLIANTTGWFLPSIGQWIYTISRDGFGGADHADNWTDNGNPPKNWLNNGNLTNLIRVLDNQGVADNLLVKSLNDRLTQLASDFSQYSFSYDLFGKPVTGNISDNYWTSSEFDEENAIRMNLGSVENKNEHFYSTIKAKPEDKQATNFRYNNVDYFAKVRPFLAF